MFRKIFWPKDLTGFENLSGLIALIFMKVYINTQQVIYATSALHQKLESQVLRRLKK